MGVYEERALKGMIPERPKVVLVNDDRPLSPRGGGAPAGDPVNILLSTPDDGARLRFYSLDYFATICLYPTLYRARRDAPANPSASYMFRLNEKQLLRNDKTH